MGAAERGPAPRSPSAAPRTACSTRCSTARDLYDLLDYEGYNAFDTAVFNFDL